MGRYGVLPVMLIVVVCAVSAPTPIKMATPMRPPVGTPTVARPLSGGSGTKTVVGSVTCQQGQGQIYYVATNGDDSNPGTEAQPFRTITRGVDVLGPGVTLCVKGGTYTESFGGDFPSGTSWDNPVLIQAYPGDTVTVRPNSGDMVVEFWGNSHHIVLDGLVLDGANVSDNVVKMHYSGSTSPHHIRVINCEIKNSPYPNIQVAHGCDYNEFINCDIHDSDSYGAYVEGSHNLFDGCDIHDNYSGWGLHVYSGYAGFAPNHNVIRNNRVYDNLGESGWGAGIGIYIGSENIAYNNLVWGTNWRGITVALGASDTEIYNNTVYGSRQHGILIGSDTSDTIVRNNIAYLNRGSQIYDEGGGATTSHNLTDINPQFVNPALYDFHLLPSSPAIDSGATLDKVSDDFDGTPRPQGAGYDIGAYEHLSSTQVTDLRVVAAVGDRPSLTVTLRWTAPAAAVTYTLRSSDTLLTMDNWSNAPIVTVPFTASEPGSIEWLTTPVGYVSGTLYLALKSQNRAGMWSKLSNNAFWPQMDSYLPLIAKDYVSSFRPVIEADSLDSVTAGATCEYTRM